MTKLSISQAWEETSAFIGNETRLLVPLALALLFLPPVAASLAMPNVKPEEMGQSGPVLLVIFIQVVITAVGFIAIARLALGRREQIGESIGHAARRMPAFLGTWLLVIFPLSFLIGVASAMAKVLVDSGNQAISIVGSLLTILLLVILLLALVRNILSLAIASVEGGGPIQIVKRGFALTKGQVLRLLAAFLLFVMAGLVSVYAVTIVVGSLVSLLLGKPEPWTVSALLIAIAVSAVQAVWSVITAVFFARLYAQRAGDVGAPSSAT